jgi:transcriptional regulator with GAF, ATPase, and Fis domain
MDPARFWLVAEQKLRSWVSVPVRAQGEISGIMLFGSRRPEAYGEFDADLARRVADHVALAIAYQRMAEEARRAAEAQERAATLETRVQSLTQEIDAISGYGRVVGDSVAWKKVLKLATQVAAAETTALCSASRAGKEVVARHPSRFPSRRRTFRGAQLRGAPEQLLESELFGYERGRSPGGTGQPGRRAGRRGRPLPRRGPEMSLSAQAKFLRVLQERESSAWVERTLVADVRVIAANHRDRGRRSSAARFARISTIVSRSSRSDCRRCASGPRTSCP